MNLHFIGVDDQGFAKMTVEQIEKIYQDAYKAGFEQGKLEYIKSNASIRNDLVHAINLPFPTKLENILPNQIIDGRPTLTCWF